jgi:hypothetical protein
MLTYRSSVDIDARIDSEVTSAMLQGCLMGGAEVNARHVM